MQNSQFNPRVIYIKNVQSEKNSMYFPCYWKVTEDVCMTVEPNKIEVEDHEDFFDQVSFIKNTLCYEDRIGCDGAKEITREEFDEFYKKTVELINKASKL